MAGEDDAENAREVFEWFCHDTYIREEKNSETMMQKKIESIKAYLRNVEGWQQQVFREGPVDKAKLSNFKCDVTFFFQAIIRQKPMLLWVVYVEVMVLCISNWSQHKQNLHINLPPWSYGRLVEQADLWAFAKAKA